MVDGPLFLMGEIKFSSTLNTAVVHLYCPFLSTRGLFRWARSVQSTRESNHQPRQRRVMEDVMFRHGHYHFFFLISCVSF